MVGASNYENTKVSMAEGRAVRDGVHAAIKAGCRMLDTKEDNFIVVGALQGLTETQRPLGKLEMSRRMYMRC